jgi:hypothetical protein
LDEIQPDDEERRHKRYADGGSVRDCVHVPGHQLKRKTSAEEESGDNNKAAKIPVPSIYEMIPQQGYQQDERCDY